MNDNHLNEKEAAGAVQANTLKHQTEEAFLSKGGSEDWNWGRERKAIATIVERAMTRDDPDVFIALMMDELLRRTSQGSDRFWYEKPWRPSTLAADYAWGVCEKVVSGKGDQRALMLESARHAERIFG